MPRLRLERVQQPVRGAAMKVIRSEPQRSERGKTLGVLSARIEGLGTRLADMRAALHQQTLIVAVFSPRWVTISCKLSPLSRLRWMYFLAAAGVLPSFWIK